MIKIEKDPVVDRKWEMQSKFQSTSFEVLINKVHCMKSQSIQPTTTYPVGSSSGRVMVSH